MNRTPLDDVELRIRLIPGVLIVGVGRAGEDTVVFTVLVDAGELASAEEEVSMVIESLESVELRLVPVTTSASVAEMIERTLVDQLGVIGCRLDANPETGIQALEVTVESLADVSQVNEFVRSLLGEEFVRTRLEVELALPLIREETRCQEP